MISIDLKVEGSGETVTCVIDDVDEDLAKRSWSVRRQGNALFRVRTSRRIGQKVVTLALARIVLSRVLERPLGKGEQAEHRDNNGLNNRRGNLRTATQQQNRWNKSQADSDSSTGVKGVYVRKDRERNRFCAAITVNKKRLRLGCYQTIEEARDAYISASIKLHGEFSPYATTTATNE